MGIDLFTSKDSLKFFASLNNNYIKEWIDRRKNCYLKNLEEIIEEDIDKIINENDKFVKTSDKIISENIIFIPACLNLVKDHVGARIVLNKDINKVKLFKSLQIDSNNIDIAQIFKIVLAFLE